MLRCLSWFPLWYLQFLSTLAYFLLYFFVGYRRKVVRTNLINSFPNKSTTEIIKIEKEYYRHLCDLIIENIWALRATKKQIKRRCAIVNPQVLEDLYRRHQNFICLLGHTGNWEWCSLSFSTYDFHDAWPIYRPIKNKVFDTFFLYLRSRFGARLIPMNQVVRALAEESTNPYVVAFIADQSPVPEYAYWTTFMNQTTGFFNGYDKIARKKNLPVFYIHFKKVARSKYQIEFEELTPHAGSMNENQLTKLYVKRLEAFIHEQPAYWLWSHRRWKHKPPIIEQ